MAVCRLKMELMKGVKTILECIQTGYFLFEDSGRYFKNLFFIFCFFFHENVGLNLPVTVNTLITAWNVKMINWQVKTSIQIQAGLVGCGSAESSEQQKQENQAASDHFLPAQTHFLPMTSWVTCYMPSSSSDKNKLISICNEAARWVGCHSAS